MDLLSEDEQWEALKRWLRANGPSILGMVALALLAWFGWDWWKERQNQQALAANVIYHQVMADFDANKTDAALAGIETLRKDYPKSGYVAAAELLAAHVHVGTNELDKAAAVLERVATTARDKLVRPIARLRLARVQAAQGNFDKALATLGTADMGPHQSAYLEVRGDILVEKGDDAGALKEYEAARALLNPEAAGPDGVGQLLDLKISDLKASAS